MKIHPLHDRVLLKRLAKTDKSKGGIIIPDSAKEKSLEARVVAVGKGKVLANGKIAEPKVKPKDRVLIEKWSGSEIKLEGEEHVIVREDEILAILD